MKIVPTGKWILLQAKEPSMGKLVLPNQKSMTEGMMIHTVIGVGDGRLASDGTRIPHTVEIGDEVILSPNAMMATPNSLLYACEGQNLVDSNDIMAVVKDRGAYMPAKIVQAGN